MRRPTPPPSQNAAPPSSQPGDPHALALAPLTTHTPGRAQVSDTPALRGARISPRAVGRAVDEAFAEMTFLHGYIHSDPHPGNIMVRPKGAHVGALRVRRVGALMVRRVGAPRRACGRGLFPPPPSRSLSPSLSLSHTHTHTPSLSDALARPPAHAAAAGRRGLLSWLLRGSWQPFEVVLLDHGSYLSIPERLRLKYCQLWCVD